MIALTISGLVVLLAHQLFAAAVDATRAVRDSRAALDRASNARRWLGAALLSLEAGVTAGDGFEGHPDRVTFSTWLQTPDGWFARRRVTLAASDGRFNATLDGGEAIGLADSVRGVWFDYLLVPGADTRWAREWISPVSAPLAVRIRVRRDGGRGMGEMVDTMLFLVKERG